jgi:secreted trypsin-like serine protease
MLATGTACLLLGAVPQVKALMAGVSPDSPAARIDPNNAASSYAGVGSVVVGGQPLSGVVIASQYVLTAAHVVSGQAPSNIQFVLNLGDPTPWTSAVESVTVYPTFSLPYDDLAVLRLARPVPDTVPVYPMYSGPIVAGLTITLVGYGSSGNGNVGVTVGASSAVKRVGSNVADRVQPTLDASGLVSQFYLYDFDGPSGSGSLGGPTIGNEVETLVAVGDSGSPAFVVNGGALQVFGINSLVISPTNTINYEFGTTGGGIVAADPRFKAWLQTATNGTLGQPVMSAADGPAPVWSTVLCAVLLGGASAFQIAKDEKVRPADRR